MKEQRERCTRNIPLHSMIYAGNKSCLHARFVCTAFANGQISIYLDKRFSSCQAKVKIWSEASQGKVKISTRDETEERKEEKSLVDGEKSYLFRS